VRYNLTTRLVSAHQKTKQTGPPYIKNYSKLNGHGIEMAITSSV